MMGKNLKPYVHNDNNFAFLCWAILQFFNSFRCARCMNILPGYSDHQFLPGCSVDPFFIDQIWREHYTITSQVCPNQICSATFAPTQVCPDPNLPEAKFAQTQVCPGQICPDPYLPKPNLPRAKFAPKEVYVSKNQQNCQISMDWDTEISNFYDIFAIISLLLSNF